MWGERQVGKGATMEAMRSPPVMRPREPFFSRTWDEKPVFRAKKTGQRASQGARERTKLARAVQPKHSRHPVYVAGPLLISFPDPVRPKGPELEGSQ